MPNYKSFEIPPREKDEIIIASGGVNPALAESVAESLGLDLTDVIRKRHGNDELYNRISDSVRNKQVFVVQSHASDNGYRTEEAINEHQYIVSAAAGSSALSVMAIAPYLGHSRGERKVNGREVVPAPLVIQNFENAGAKTRFSMMSIDLHSPQTAEILRSGPYEHLTAQPELRRAVREHIGKKGVKNCVVVAPDSGAVKNNNRHAQELSEADNFDVEVIFMGKERPKEDSTKLIRQKEILGVEGKICLTFDDMIDGGDTMVSAAKILKESGAEAIYVGATHAIFSDNATEKLLNSDIDKVFVTDTLPVDRAKSEMGKKLHIVRIGPLIGRAIYEIVTGGSISKLFDDQNHR